MYVKYRYNIENLLTLAAKIHISVRLLRANRIDVFFVYNNIVYNDLLAIYLKNNKYPLSRF